MNHATKAISPLPFDAVNGSLVESMHGLENSGIEPNVCELEFVGSTPQTPFYAQALAAEAQRPHEGHDSTLDESKLCLLDTACTSCLRSRRWRQAFEKWLPEGVACTRTGQTKNFHFANGQSESQLTVWKVPVYLNNIHGEIFSAELPSGSTPLLLSLPTMTALGMVLDLAAGKVTVAALGIEMFMATTATKHIALEVAFDDNKPLAEPRGSKEEPQITAEDLVVYYLREGELPVLHDQSFATGSPIPQRGVPPDLGRRGVARGDRLAQVSERRALELKKKCQQQAAEDRRSWAALRRNFTMAEQWCTRDFQDTVIFEPFGGTCAVTSWAAREFSWTCSRPLPADGGDLLTKAAGQAIDRNLREHRPYLLLVSCDSRLWSTLGNGSRTDPVAKKVGQRIGKQLVRLCCEQHRFGRYYLFEAPPARHTWIFDNILAKTLKNAGGKFVVGDLCAYGCRSSGSRQPTRRRTGWLSNSELLLNALGRQCHCPGGQHAPDADSQGFPTGLCRVICQAVQSNMGLDYAVHMAHYAGKHALAAGDLDGDGDAEMEEEYSDGTPTEEPWQDEWEFVGEDRLVRIHRLPRQRLFLPLSTTAPPVALDRLQPRRRTTMRLQDGTHRDLEDSWHHGRVEQRMDFNWTGTTEFYLRGPEPEQAKEERGPEPPPEPRDPPGLPEDVDMEEYEPSVPEDLGEQLPLPAGVNYDPQASAVPVDSEPEQAEEERPEPPPEPRDHRALRRGRRQRHLQRGFWQECEEESVLDLLEATADHLRESGAGAWFRLGTDSDLGRAWVSLESGRADVVLILCSLVARRMKKPQPHAGPLEVPLRKSFLLLNGHEILTTDWEDWNSMAPSAQVRPLVAQGRILYVVLYGKEVGEGGQLIEANPGDRQQVAEVSRQRKWQALPRELKLAIRRVHVNLGHAPTAAMLRALRISRASETAIKACRLFRCPDCPRLGEPKQPRPSKLPLVDEFNVQVGLDIFSEKDAKGHTWTWLNVFDQGTLFQVCSLLGQTHANPTSAEVLRAFTTSWTDWAGFPERGVVTDRAKYFLADFAEEIASHGCHFDTAAKAAPWQIGQVERHGGLWKETFRKLCWDQQISSYDEVLWATSATNQAKNSLVRKAGFSPAQWVLGKDVRLPASLADEDEVGRVGAQALADTPGTRFHRKNQIRMAARESFTKAANSDAIRRAELRQVRPSRGPFPVGTYVFYYDAANKQPGPNCWRGIARVVGREGQSTIWLSHRGILIAVSPEHLSLAHDEEVEQWTVIANEHSLVDAMPASGGSGFLDLRQSPKPPEEAEQPRGDGEQPDEEMPGTSDQGGSTTSIERQASERDAQRMRKSSEFFSMKERERREQRGRASQLLPAAEQPEPGQPSTLSPAASPDWEGLFEDELPPLRVPEYDPDLDDYHQSRPALARQLSPIVDDPEAEANEREAKRQRVIKGDETANMVTQRFDAYAVVSSKGYLKARAREHYQANVSYYTTHAVSEATFLFWLFPEPL